jgi:serine protease
MKRIRLAFLLFAVVELSACSQVSYQLTAVLPAPVIPGQVVTAFGTLPEEAQVLLNDVPVPATRVVNGWEFTIPETQLAGNGTVMIKGGGAELEGSLQIRPVISAVKMVGAQLEIVGKGWSSQLAPEELELYVSGSKIEPLEIGEGTLNANLPDAISYGSFQVQITIRGQASVSHTVLREAAAVSGKVIFPAALAQAYSPPVVISREPKRYWETRLVVRHEVGALDNFLARHQDVKSKEVALLGMTQLDFESVVEARKALTDIKALAGVHKVDFDQVVSSDGFAPVYSNRLELADASDPQWHLALTGVEDAWQISKGSGVVVAVVDTGVALDHPDLTANLLPGYDFVDDDAFPYDEDGHGTHVAGLIAANGQVHGTAPEASLLPVRVLGEGGGSAFTVAQGILWAAGLLDTPVNNTHPVQVINLSLGSQEFSESIAAAVEQALDAGIIVVAATGNAGGPVAYPAAQRGVVSVTALAGPVTAYQPWYANKGLGTWITAYGGDTSQDQNKDNQPDGIYSSDLLGGVPSYSYRMGTSMAAPQVSGLAALALASGTPSWLLRDSLSATATDLGVKGYDYNFGFGLASGRTTTVSSPRTYVLAVDEAGLVSTWTLV